MNPNERETRRKIFRQELFKLKTEGYLTDELFETVAKAHVQYHFDLLQAESILKEEVPKEEVAVKKPITAKPEKVKKTLTPEQIRERNITWSLNIGVIFLLIGGLFVATSNWESMTSLMKSGSIAIVSLLFYGLAVLSKKVLHINHTAFSFTVLASLFLPIFILSLGWFGLLGEYLSVGSEGGYLLGMLCGLVPLSVYYLLAKKLESRLFVWFTFLSLSAGAAFFLAWLTLTIDYFYLTIMGFNGCLLAVYQFFKNRDSLKLFTKEFVVYVQVNLVLSTLFMLFIYHDKLLYSFNLLLTAMVYLAMVYVSEKKEYHFVFSVMLVYGAYQLIENTVLDTFGAIFYALIGFGMVLVPKVLGEKFALEKAFRLTSAVISGFAFIYISLQGILLRSGEPSLVLLLAYLIIAANFIYLAHHGLNKIFPYLGSLFLGSALYEAVLLSTNMIPDFHFSLALFCAAFLLFLIFGLLLSVKSLDVIKWSSRDVGLALMFVGIAAGTTFMQWWELGLMLIFLTIVALLVYKYEDRPYFQEIAKWVAPLALGLSLTAFGEEINVIDSNYYNQFGNAVNIAFGAIIVMVASFVWRKAKVAALAQTAMFVAPIFYTLAIICALLSPINEIWVQPLIFIVGICFYFILYKSIGYNWVPFMMSGASILAYFSMMSSIEMKIEFNHIADSLVASTGAVLLLLAAFVLRNKDSNIFTAFSWAGHGIYPFLLIYTYFAHHHDGVYSFFIAATVYGASIVLTRNEWKIKFFLYGCFTALFMAISLGLEELINRYYENYEFPLTSAMILVFWMFANQSFKKRTALYLVPFSLIGILFTLNTYPYEWLPYVVTLAYAVGLLGYLHKINWDLLGIIPLFLTFLGTVLFSFNSRIGEVEKLLLAGSIGLVLCVIGQFAYSKIVSSGNKLKEIKVDAYSAVALLYFLFMYYFMNEQIWTHVLPGLLITMLIWLQKKRVVEKARVYVSLITGVLFLQPYYALIGELDVPRLWSREAIVLPWVLLAIFTRLKLKAIYANVVKLVEWAMLLIVSMLLIQDGLSSSTIYDAIILGSLALLSMLAGMFAQIKSYFFVGTGVLLLNVFLQTRPYWGNMPWWGYLLIVGFILITVASFNEWNKQKTQKGESTFIAILKTKTINKLKHWD